MATGKEGSPSCELARKLVFPCDCGRKHQEDVTPHVPRLSPMQLDGILGENQKRTSGQAILETLANVDTYVLPDTRIVNDLEEGWVNPRSPKPTGFGNLQRFHAKKHGKIVPSLVE